MLGDIDPIVPIPPINVNYFVFNGGVEPEKLSSLENILKAHADNSINQNNIFILEDKEKAMVEEPPASIFGTTAKKGRGRPRNQDRVKLGNNNNNM